MAAPTIQTTQIFRWIVSRILGDSALTTLIGGATPRIANEVASKNVLFPYVLVSAPSPPIPNYTLDARAVTNDGIYIIRGVTKDDSYGNAAQGNQLEAIANRILTLFHDPGINLTYNIHSCLLDAEFALTEPQDDIQYRHLGGRFRISTQAP